MNCGSIPVGSLDRLFEVHRRGNIDDGMGGQEKGWAKIDEMWGSLMPVSARQRFQAMKLEMSITHKIMMRWSPAIVVDSDLKLVYEGREFNIRSVINVEELDRFIEIMADEGVVQ